jgi:hypothetical protein
MAEKQEEIKFAPEVDKAITEASTSQEIADLAAAQPRDPATGKFVAKEAATVEPKKETVEPAKVAEEPVIIKDTFFIGGKEIEFTGESAADIQKQVKVALQTYEATREKPVEKKEEVKAGPTKEELAALQLKAASGDAEAMGEYIVKSGTLDRYLESKGVNLTQVKQVLEQTADQKVVQDWNGAVKDFLAESDWPGGTQNEKLLKYKLAELKDEQGQPLAYNPSKASLMKAYESLKADGLLFPVEQKTETTTTTTATTAKEPVKVASTGTKKETGSTMFGTTGGSTTRKTETTSKAVPTITDDMTPQEIMAAYKTAVVAQGQSPDDVLRSAYSGKA